MPPITGASFSFDPRLPTPYSFQCVCVCECELALWSLCCRKHSLKYLQGWIDLKTPCICVCVLCVILDSAYFLVLLHFPDLEYCKLNAI